MYVGWKKKKKSIDRNHGYQLHCQSMNSSTWWFERSTLESNKNQTTLLRVKFITPLCYIYYLSGFHLTLLGLDALDRGCFAPWITWRVYVKSTKKNHQFVTAKSARGNDTESMRDEGHVKEMQAIAHLFRPFGHVAIGSHDIKLLLDHTGFQLSGWWLKYLV